ncbi:MAG: CHASE2 domain-containing protein [Candidatus Omnitrophica bacterium]|nr:CHASE2 domain-containing protein [Candidatus Omnitrophota bacterium]
MKKIHLTPAVIRITVLFIIIILVLLVSYNRSFDIFELHLFDLRYKLRPVLKTSDKIVFVEISDDSIRKLGSWPFDRKYHALMVQVLKEAGAKAIIFDVFFSEPKDGDQEFGEAVRQAGNVYLPYVFTALASREYALPSADSYDAPLLDRLAAVAKGTGHINIVPDMDGKFRRIPPFIRYGEADYPHMAFKAALDYLGIPLETVKIVPGKYVQLRKDLRIPLDLESNIIINFPGPWVETFRHYSYVDVLTSYVASMKGEAQGAVRLSEFKDAVCFIGITATAAPDAHPSPFEALYPGVGLHASLLNGILNRSFIWRAGKEANCLILLFLMALTAVITFASRKRQGLIFVAGVIAAVGAVSVVAFTAFGVWIDVFYPVLVIILSYLGLTFAHYISEMRKRELLEKELTIAKKIQESFLPKIKPDVKGIMIEAKMMTARQVGGDLYDFVQITDKRAGVMVGDVSGKGVPAALYMAKVVSDFKPCAKEGSPATTLAMVNKVLSEEGGTNLFVTVAYLIFDVEEKRMTYSLGGHLPIVMVRAGEKDARLLDSKDGMPLGLMDCVFSDTVMDLCPGDLFILYTDGVTEAMDSRQEMFGTDRMVEIVSKMRDSSCEAIVNAVHDAVKRFEGASQHDDITVIAIRVL